MEAIQRDNRLRNQGIQAPILQEGSGSSRDTIPNCLGEFREIRESKERTGMRLMAIRQARLEPLALSVSGRDRMVNGGAVASGEERFDFSAGNARFGDIIK